MLMGITIAFALVALAFGVALFIWGMRHEGKGVGLAKVTGLIVSILSALIVICSIFMMAGAPFGMKKMMSECPMCNMMHKEHKKSSMMQQES